MDISDISALVFCVYLLQDTYLFMFLSHTNQLLFYDPPLSLYLLYSLYHLNISVICHCM